jgi:ferredoxin
VVKKITPETFQGFVAALMNGARLFAPVADGDVTAFRQIDNPEEVTLDFYNTTLSPKNVLFPQCDEMVRYRIAREGTESDVVPIDDRPQIVLGVRPCDVKSFEIMDAIFESGGITDPYWKTRRDATTIIGYAFDEVDEVDFFSAFDIHATDDRGSDLFMVRRNKDFLLKAVTGKGEALLASLELDTASAEEEAFYRDRIAWGVEQKTRTINLEHAPEKLAKVFDSPYWGKAAMACLSCGVCTFVCPTCHCFDINDETLFRSGSRRKLWDACMFTDFTLEASGHNPRTKTSQRLRQRVNHKFSYYVTNFGVTLCVGCGRCTRFCPVNIDILSVAEGALKESEQP